MRKIYYVRHGETYSNAEGRYAGSLDVELNDRGKQQAQEVGNVLKTYDIDIMVSSPQKRAQQTAKIINDKLNLVIETENDLREISVGLFEGLTREEAAQKYPKRWEQGSRRIFDVAHHDGESFKDVQDRVFKALDQILTKHPDKNILIIAHGFVSRVVHRYFNREITDEEFFNYSLQNCAVVEYETN